MLHLLRRAARRRQKVDTATVQPNTTTKSRMTDALVEKISDFAAIIVVVSGLVAWWFAREDANRKSDELERYKEQSRKEVAGINAVAAEANERAAQLGKEASQARLELERVKTRQEPRRASEAFTKALLGKPKANIVEIWYQPDDGEAFDFALDVYNRFSEAGWALLGENPIPIPEQPAGKVPKWAPLSMRAGGMERGVTVVATDVPRGTNAEHSPLWAVLKAFASIGVSAAGSGSDDKSFPSDKLRVMVGSKP